MTPGLLLLILSIVLGAIVNVVAWASARRLDRLVSGQQRKEFEARIQASKVSLGIRSDNDDEALAVGAEAERMTNALRARQRAQREARNRDLKH